MKHRRSGWHIITFVCTSNVHTKCTTMRLTWKLALNTFFTKQKNKQKLSLKPLLTKVEYFFHNSQLQLSKSWDTVKCNFFYFKKGKFLSLNICYWCSQCSIANKMLFYDICKVLRSVFISKTLCQQFWIQGLHIQDPRLQKSKCFISFKKWLFCLDKVLK